MTIAIGLLGSRCAILASDSQETDEIGFKDHALKIHSSLGQGWRIGKTERSVVAVTGAGPGIHLDVISDEIASLAESRLDWDMVSFEAALGDCVATFFSKNILPLLPHIDNRIYLIVAGQFDGQSWLWTTDTSIVKRTAGFEAVGSGRNYAKQVESYGVNESLSETVIAAIRGVKYAIRRDQYCGNGISLVCLHNNRAHRIPWYLIEPIEKLLDKYESVERSAFLYAIGHDFVVREKKLPRELAQWYRTMRGEFLGATKEIEEYINR